jgi:hypothetical protein
MLNLLVKLYECVAFDHHVVILIYSATFRLFCVDTQGAGLTW